MKKFTEWANNPDNINTLVKAMGVSKNVVHDELLNTFGELGQENKWEDRTFGGDWGIENTYEKIFKPKSKSIGPGQIKFNDIAPDLKEKFGINKPKDLYDWDKVIPLMTAMNIRNRQWMERKDEDLSKYLIGKPGVAAEDLKYGVGRWTPYMYRGSLKIPTTREEAKLMEEGSYADKIFHNIDNNLERTLLNPEGAQDLQPVEIISKKKKKKELGGSINGINLNNNWLKKYNL